MEKKIGKIVNQKYLIPNTNIKPEKMKNRLVKGIAGTFILISLLLAIKVNINWLWFTTFVGANLLQSSISKWCLLEVILGKLGVKD
jgi:hypothetical protein